MSHRKDAATLHLSGEGKEEIDCGDKITSGAICDLVVENIAGEKELHPRKKIRIIEVFTF